MKINAVQNFLDSMLKLAAEAQTQAQAADPATIQKQKQDPTIVKQLLLQNLQTAIPQEIILNQIYPDVNSRGLATTVAGKNGAVIFVFKNNSQKMWNPVNKQYGEIPAQNVQKAKNISYRDLIKKSAI